MKPDAYMPFYWMEFWHAVEGLPDQSIVAYQRVLSNYWHQNHCVGLRDDDEFLRRICRCDRDDWQSVRDTIFDNDRFMTQDADGLWHQKRAQEEWIHASAAYEKALVRAKAGAAARWKPNKHKAKLKNASSNASSIP